MMMLARGEVTSFLSIRKISLVTPSASLSPRRGQTDLSAVAGGSIPADARLSGCVSDWDSRASELRLSATRFRVGR